ncbi:MAG: winged helix DNA-binding domain-containing protein [Chitinophagales bacterium]
MMTKGDIVSQRLHNQHISESAHGDPASIVAALTAMQAQEFPMAKWAIGLRLPGINEEKIEADFNQGAFLRTHMLRPTWHFVTPKDIQWVLKLTSPNIHAFNGYYYRQAALSPSDFKKATRIFEKTLAGENFLSRANLQSILEKNKIKADGLRLGLIFMFAELEGLICSGPRIGKQFTYALLEERIKGSIAFNPKQPLDELTRRYFSTRGPATIQDYIWWSGLKATQAREGVDRLKKEFKNEKIAGREYIYLPANRSKQENILSCFLLPDYDEYGISYKNREAYNRENSEKEFSSIDPRFKQWLIVDGLIGGKWRRVLQKGKWIAEAQCFSSLNKNQRKAVINAIDRYDAFTLNAK